MCTSQTLSLTDVTDKYVLKSISSSTRSCRRCTTRKSAGRSNEHVEESNVQTACPLPRKATHRNAPVAMSPDPGTPKPFIVELLMSSRGHFLLIRVSIYQNVCIHE